MAKQLVSPVERHVDKGVLGLTVLALVGIIALYGITTPNQVELRAGERVKPGGVEERLDAKAKEVRRAVQSAAAEEPEVVLKFEEFQKATDAFASVGIPREPLPNAMPFNAEPPLVGPPVVIEGYIVLAETIPVTKPIIVRGRSLLQGDMPEGTAPEDAPAFQRATEWVTIAAVFDREGQSAHQFDAYNGYRDVIYGPLDVQRRAMRPDGTFAEEDWKNIKTLTDELPEETVPTIGLQQTDGVVSAVDADYAAFDIYKNKVAAGTVQVPFLRPLFPPIVAGDTWCPPRPGSLSRRELTVMDEDLTDAHSEPSDVPEDRYPPECVDLVIPATGPASTAPADINKERFAQSHKLRAEAEATDVEDLIIQSNNLLADIANDSKSSAADKAKAKQLFEEGQQAKLDIQRRTRQRLAREAIDKKPKAGAEEQQYVRPLRSKQVVWALDALPDSLVPGQTYQYRMRVQVLNPYAGKPNLLKNKLDAAKVFVTGPWSDPSEPVFIPPDSQFFVTSVAQTGAKLEAVIEMFRWFEGVWVKNKSTFKFAVGDRVARTDRHPVPVPGDPTKIDNAPVDFDAGAVVLNVEPERVFRTVQKASGKTLRFQKDGKQAVVAFVDSSGNVFERFTQYDKANPELADNRDRVWKPESRKAATDEPAQPTQPEPPKPGRGGGG